MPGGAAPTVCRTPGQARPDGPAVAQAGDTAVAAAPTAGPFIGLPGEDVVALAFAGGGFDTALQLGVAHAWLVGGLPDPDVVVGISAGAVNAVAFAEILQAGGDADAEAAAADAESQAHDRESSRQHAQTARMRGILRAYEEAPADLLRSLMPDLYEVKAGRPIAPLELPTHFRREREERERVVRSRSGTIRLFNHLLSVRIQISVVTQAAARLLLLKSALAEGSGVRKAFSAFRHALQLWLIVGRNLQHLTPHAWVMLYRLVFRDRHRWVYAGALSQVPRWRFSQYAVAAVTRVWGLLVAFTLWLTVPLALLCAWLFRWTPDLGRAFDDLLYTYDLHADLGDAHYLRQLYVQLFDRDYYGPRDMDAVVERALNPAAGPGECDARPKKIGDYASGKCSSRIHVGVVAADVRTGEMVTMGDDVPVVDALMAATAVVPLFRAVSPPGQGPASDGTRSHCIDGMNISN